MFCSLTLLSTHRWCLVGRLLQLLASETGFSFLDLSPWESLESVGATGMLGLRIFRSLVDKMRSLKCFGH